MSNHLRMMAVLAHPDDESLGFGGTLVAYAAQGVEISIVTATRGELGWRGAAADNPGPVVVGLVREAELGAAAAYLGASEIVFLDYLDGQLPEIDMDQASARIAREIRRFKPQVVLTFGPEGAYGHPDHVAISQLATSAVMRAANGSLDLAGYLEPHSVDKLYYRVWAEDEMAAYHDTFGDTSIEIAASKRSFVSWPEWAISVKLDTTKFWTNVWAAVRSHRSQLASLSLFDRLPVATQERLWGSQHFYRVISSVGSAGAGETDLFAGLRGAA